jgi:hypothetical protein
MLGRTIENIGISAQEQAYTYIADVRHRRIRAGAGEIPSIYTLADLQEWSKQSFPESENRIIHEQNLTAQEVLHRCQQLAEKYLAKYRRDNGPASEDKNDFAHSYRTVRVVVDEFAIEDPEILATTYLHDVYTRISDPHEIAAFEEDVRTTFKGQIHKLDGNVFAEKVLASLQTTHRLSRHYASLAKKVETKFQPEIERGLTEGFTPKSYDDLKGDILKEFVGKDKGGYPDLLELMQEVADGNYAPIFALIAEAIENSRYPKLPRNGQEYSLQERKAQVRDSLNVVFYLLPLARGIEQQAVVNPLSEVAAKVFFPEQWNAMQAVLQKKSQERKQHGSFNVQLRANQMALSAELGKIKTKLEEKGIQISEVPQAEYERRKFLSLQKKWSGPLLRPYEFTRISDIKTAGSIYSKWLKMGRTHRLEDARWLGPEYATNPEMSYEETQELIMSQFSSEDVWDKYLDGASDVLRFKYLLGEEVARLFALPGDSEHSEETVFAALERRMKFPDEKIRRKRGEKITTSPVMKRKRGETIVLNKFITHKNGVMQQRDEAMEWRVKPEVREDEIFFEYHLVLLLKELTGDTRLQPVEVMFESVAQNERNTMGDELHLFYKLEELIRRDEKGNKLMSPEEKTRITSLYKQVWEQLMIKIYDGSLVQEEEEMVEPVFA